MKTLIPYSKYDNRFNLKRKRINAILIDSTSNYDFENTYKPVLVKGRLVDHPDVSVGRTTLGKFAINRELYDWAITLVGKDKTLHKHVEVYKKLCSVYDAVVGYEQKKSVLLQNA